MRSQKMIPSTARGATNQSIQWNNGGATIMKNYSFFDTYIRNPLISVGDGLQAIGAHVSNFFVRGYHRLRGSWYCPYCGKSHPRRRVKFALTIKSKDIRIDELRQGQCTEKPCVCFLGYSALVADRWRPKTTSLSDALTQAGKALHNLFRAFSSGSKPTSTITVSRHVGESKNKPGNEEEGDNSHGTN